MMGFRKYEDLEPLRRLKNRGRELIGKIVLFTEKRDGQCVSLWRNDEDKLCISSHNLEIADDDIQKKMIATPEYSKVYGLLRDQKDEYQKNFILYGELLLTVSPTRIEPKRKYIHWILFDIYDMDEQRYLSYEQIYQLSYSYKIPIVRVIDRCIPTSIEELEDKIKETLKWCKRHRKEGVVLKVYNSGQECTCQDCRSNNIKKTTIQIFAKEKVNLPKLPKIERPDKLTFPPMDDHTIQRALQHAWDEMYNDEICHTCTHSEGEPLDTCDKCREEHWKDKSIVMPLIAKHMAIEGREHNFSVPRNLYEIYLSTPIEKIKTKI